MLNESWEPKRGDRIRIVDPKSVYYGQEGVVDDIGMRGQLYVRHADGRVVFHPWGYEKV